MGARSGARVPARRSRRRLAIRWAIAGGSVRLIGGNIRRCRMGRYVWSPAARQRTVQREKPVRSAKRVAVHVE
jgi:hypothetical protein